MLIVLNSACATLSGVSIVYIHAFPDLAPA
jgi:hypothetical protein